MSITFYITDNNITHSKFYTFIVFSSPKHVQVILSYVESFNIILNKQLVRENKVANGLHTNSQFVVMRFVLTM